MQNDFFFSILLHVSVTIVVSFQLRMGCILRIDAVLCCRACKTSWDFCFLAKVAKVSASLLHRIHSLELDKVS